MQHLPGITCSFLLLLLLGVLAQSSAAVDPTAAAQIAWAKQAEELKVKAEVAKVQKAQAAKLQIIEAKNKAAVSPKFKEDLKQLGDVLVKATQAKPEGKKIGTAPEKLPEKAAPVSHAAHIAAPKTAGVSTPITEKGHAGVQATSSAPTKAAIVAKNPELHTWTQNFLKDLSDVASKNRDKNAAKAKPAMKATSKLGATKAPSSSPQVKTAVPKEAPASNAVPKLLNASSKPATAAHSQASVHRVSITTHQKAPNRPPPMLPKWAQELRRDLSKLSDKQDKKSALNATRQSNASPTKLPYQALKVTNGAAGNTSTSQRSAAGAVRVQAKVPPKAMSQHAAVQQGATRRTSSIACEGPPPCVMPTKAPPPPPKRQEAHKFEVPAKSAHRFMEKMAETCQCEFKDTCSCHASMEFMDCIAHACASGRCNCHELQYRDACTDMANTCQSLDFECTKEKAVCISELESDLERDHPEKKVTAKETIEELRILKEKKCRLEISADDGWLNARRQLEKVDDEINSKIAFLVEHAKRLPEMHCEKHFEEWHELHPKRAKSAAVSLFSMNFLMLSVAMVFPARTIIM